MNAKNIRFLISIFTLSILSIGLHAQNKQSEDYRIVFYNTENLFDPFDDPATNDGEYTPNGKSHWTMAKLDRKVMMVYRAIISASSGRFPDIIGLVEIENLWILEYLIKKTPLKDGNYGIIHKESPDPRGIDVALLYRKETIVPLDYAFIPVGRNGKTKFSSRDILLFKAGLNQETFCFIVNHWPSRSGGYMETLGKRNIAANIARGLLDSIQTKNPKIKLLLMGDFNATPNEDCFIKILRASLKSEQSSPTQLVNLSYLWLRSGIGTIRTKGLWEIFDQFICSANLMQKGGLQISTAETRICTEDFLLEEDKRYLGKKPFRTYLGPVYHGGVSDHLPISTLLKKVR